MRNRLQLFLWALCFSVWPGVLHAYQLEQMPPASAPSSFLLVAGSQMMDPRFRNTVVLVTRHGNAGHVGVIINRQQNITLDVIFPAHLAAKEFNLFTGGPVVPKQISYLVRGGENVPGALTISPSIYLGYHLPSLVEIFNKKRRATGLRVVHGLSTWAPGQLEKEIGHGAWFVMPLDDEIIFDRPAAEIWPEMFRRANSIDR